MTCTYCDAPLTIMEFSLARDGHRICMACVRARARATVTKRCSCGRKARPGTECRVGSRRWIPCQRCLATIRQVA